MRLDRPHPPSLSPRALALAGWTAFLLANALFLTLGWGVSTHNALVNLDARVAEWAQGAGSPLLVAFFLGITHLHAMAAVALWTAVFGAWLARRKEYAWLLTLLLSVLGGALVNVLLKAAYERVRPHFDVPLVDLGSFSFPSGHTAGAVAFYGVLAAFLVSRTRDPRRRAACVAVAVAAVALVAFSRVYLGAHYLSDVAAAACSSIAWLVLCLSAGHALVRRKLKPRWLALGAVVLAAAAAAVALPLQDWSQALETRLDALPPLVAVLVYCAASLVGTLLLVPNWVFPLLAGAVFGVAWGLAAALAAAALSAAAAFLLARYVIRGWVERAVRRDKRFGALDAAVAKEPWTMVALMRVSPLMPSGVKSYALGLTRVPLGVYLGASLLGMLPGTVLKVYVGAAGRDALTDGTPLKWTLFAVGAAATVAVAWFIARKARGRVSARIDNSPAAP